jgi:hypothetical protein
MCYLQKPLNIRTDEGLLSTVVATVAAYATHVVLGTLLAPRWTVNTSSGTLILINLSTATLMVQRRKNCSACGHGDD